MASLEYNIELIIYNILVFLYFINLLLGLLFPLEFFILVITLSFSPLLKLSLITFTKREILIISRISGFVILIKEKNFN